MGFKLKKDCKISLEEIIYDYGICDADWENWTVREFGKYGWTDPIPHAAIQRAISNLSGEETDAVIEWLDDNELLEKESEYKFLGVFTDQSSNEYKITIYALFEQNRESKQEKEYWSNRIVIHLGHIDKKTGKITLYNLARENEENYKLLKEAGLLADIFPSLKINRNK